MSELYRNDTVTLLQREDGVYMTGAPDGVPSAAAFLRRWLPVGVYTELIFETEELAGASKETLDDIVTVRTSCRSFVLDRARFVPDYRLASAYAVRVEADCAAVFRDTLEVARCMWDARGALRFETNPAYQQAGLATACGKIAVAHLLEQGIMPCMEVRRHQYPAAALARKLGFVQSGEHPVWGLCKEDG